MYVTRQNFQEALERVRELVDCPVYEQRLFETGDHPPPDDPFDPETEPVHYRDLESRFAWRHIQPMADPRVPVLDVGSYREFILFLLTRMPVTTVDVRDRDGAEGETVLTCDAKALPLENDSMAAVVSLHSVEHFGLGRYGDDLDLEADRKAVREMRRVLMPGGTLVLTTHITRGAYNICFNAHRNYTYGRIREMLVGLECVEERFFNKNTGDWLEYDQVSIEPRRWDVYCGAWRKPGGDEHA